MLFKITYNHSKITNVICKVNRYCDILVLKNVRIEITGKTFKKGSHRTSTPKQQ